MQRIAIVAALALIAAGCTDPEQAAPDNSAVNQRDRQESARTPIDQAENRVDLEITQKIRQAVVKDDDLSVTAKNVKIITEGGRVTLRGPVKDDGEKQAIRAAAERVAGAANVDDQLEVAK